MSKNEELNLNGFKIHRRIYYEDMQCGKDETILMQISKILQISLISCVDYFC